MSDEAEKTAPAPAPVLPDGDYAIVEMLGHRTLVGRCQEVNRFGTAMLMIEPIFRGALLPPIYHGGSSIYCFTPCSKDVALARAPRAEYQLPTTLAATLPPETPDLITHNGAESGFDEERDEDQGEIEF